MILAATGVVSSCGVFALTAVATYKPYGVPELRLEEWKAKQTAIRATQQAAARETSTDAGAPTLLPAAVVDDTEHDFGLLDAGSSAWHTFVIRNEGKSPLAISAADTSCKCTISESSADLVAPGSSAEVTLTWNTGASRNFYRQYAIIRTNDPARPEIELSVSGRIQTVLGFATDELIAPPVGPGSGAEASTVVYSQTLDGFEIVDVRSELPGMQYRLEPVADEVLHALQAKSAWRLFVSTDASIEKGSVVDAVRISVQSDQLDQPGDNLVREIMFRGRVLSPITFYGSQLHSEEGFDFGTVNAGTESAGYVIVRVRGTYLPKTMEVSRVEPAFLRAEMTPIDSRPGVFKLTITIPKTAPQTFFNVDQKLGFVEVRDPENPSLRSWFPVRGAVVGL